MTASSFFSASYTEAREKFLSACARRSLATKGIRNPNAMGANGEDLFSDIVQIGGPDASKALLILSGTHGVEGYCGSGVQIGLLNEGYFEDLPADLSVVMVHAVNPYGFSHDRRVNEDNIDLNRNYVAFDTVKEIENDYSRVHPFILPDEWDGPSKEIADKKIQAFIEENGLPAFQAAASGGQYHHSDGIFYGGDRSAWSWEMLRSVLLNYMGKAELAAVIDVHTGLGPYGYGELITLGPNDQKARAKEWFKEQVTDPDAGTSTSAPVTGSMGHGVSDILSNTSMGFIALEHGTYEIPRVLEAIRADNWLYQKGDVDSDLGRAIKKEIKDAFYIDEDAWKLAVWTRASEVIEMALEGLQSERE